MFGKEGKGMYHPDCMSEREMLAIRQRKAAAFDVEMAMLEAKKKALLEGKDFI